jgi:hypothetical protein
MTSWIPCPATGPAGFDLDSAVLVSPDVLDCAGGLRTSRATATPWRESLWRTGSGEHVVGLDSGGAGSSGLDADRWRWVSPALAEEWLRSQGLDETADVAFGPVHGRPPAPLPVLLDHGHRARLEQLCVDEDVSLSHLLALVLDRFLLERSDPVRAVTPWWPDGVAREVRPVPSDARGLPAETWEP